MSTEATRDARGDVARRARLHAALAEPARLRIVDRLELSDATPGELQRALGMTSNLLAHHLRILEEEGLIVRHRSQGDRRRTYLQLVSTALDAVSGSADERLRVPRVVFVCTANTARSQLAAALWNSRSAVPATSAGTAPADSIAPGALAVARRRRLRLREARPRALHEVLRPGDCLVTVCDHAHETLGRGLRGDETRALHWSVPDPVPDGSDTAFDVAYDDLATRVANLASRLIDC